MELQDSVSGAGRPRTGSAQMLVEFKFAKLGLGPNGETGAETSSFVILTFVFAGLMFTSLF